MAVTTSTPNVDTQGRSLVGLFSDLWRETSTLLRCEAELAKAELSEKMSQVGSGVSSLAVGGAIAFAGFLLLLAAAVNALALVLDPQYAAWLAPLIVGGIVLVIGLIALMKGRSNLKSSNLAPTRTTQSLRRDAQLAREHLR